MSIEKFSFPTEFIELPSKGLLYSEEHSLRSGKVEMRYMSARDEDILTNINYIKQGIVVDKLLESLLVTKFKLDDLLIGDKNALVVGARILGYGKDYKFKTTNPINGEIVEISADLSKVKEKELNLELYKNGNNFSFTLPRTYTLVTFKLLTEADDKKIDAEIKGLKKITPNSSFNITTRLKHMITSVGGETDIKIIREFVDNQLLADDSRALRKYVVEISPDIDLKTNFDFGNGDEEVSVPISIDFFWPELQ